MPETYRVTDPKTGLKVRITGDSPPTEAELEEIFAKLQPAKSAQPSREDASMASLREMAKMEGLSDEELNARMVNPVGSTMGPAMVGAMAVPAIGASRLAQAATSPLGMAGIKAGISAARGGDALDVVSEGAEGYVQGAGLGVLGKVPGRVLEWMRRGKSVAPVAKAASAPATVARFPTNPEEAAAAMRLPAGPPQWHGPRTPPELLHQAAQAKAAEGAAAVAPTVAPKVATRVTQATPSAPVESSTIEEQPRQTVKLSKGARQQLSAAQKLEARVVELKTRQGLSEAQIVAALKEGFGIREPGAAKTMVDMILSTHGLK